MESPRSRTFGSLGSACWGRTSHVHSISSGIEAGFWARTEEDSIRKPRERTTSARITTRPAEVRMCGFRMRCLGPKVIADSQRMQSLSRNRPTGYRLSTGQWQLLGLQCLSSAAVWQGAKRVAWSEQERIESHCPQYLRNVIRIITETGLRTDKGLTPIR